MELVNVPVPVPSLVQVPPLVGFVDVLQQTPLSVTGTPPSEVIVPPLLAVVLVIAETAVVVRAGRVKVELDTVENVRSFP